MLVGVIALSHTLFGLPLDWIEKWWPLALIGVGAWLIYPTFAGKKNDGRGGVGTVTGQHVSRQ